MWPDTRLIELFGVEAPIVQAPMAGAMNAELVIATAEGGALGSLPCAMLSPEKIRWRPWRDVLGPVAPDAPAFPHAASALAPLRAAAERAGSGDFTPLWAGQAVGLGRETQGTHEMPAAELTRALIASSLRVFSGTR